MSSGTGTVTSTDALIIGAGPCGLFQAFELGLLGIRSHIVDSLGEAGGQCSALYPEKPIYDIPGLPVVGASELIDRLLEQVRPFDPVLHFDQEVVKLRADGNGGFDVQTAAGARFSTRAVVIAGGLGSFQPRPLRADGAERFVGENLAYRVTDKKRYAGKRVCILGGGDSALDWALALHELDARITIVHRRDSFRAAPASVQQMCSLAEKDPDRMRWLVGRIDRLLVEGDKLAGLEVGKFGGAGAAKDAQDSTEMPTQVLFDELLVFYGLSPNLGPIAQWGLDGDRRHLGVSVETCETSEPGIYAIGDISTYPGKKKLILTGFHEAAMAAYAIRKRLDPDAKDQVQYTTTSSELQQRLGVASG